MVIKTFTQHLFMIKILQQLWIEGTDKQHQKTSKLTVKKKKKKTENFLRHQEQGKAILLTPIYYQGQLDIRQAKEVKNNQVETGEVKLSFHRWHVLLYTKILRNSQNNRSNKTRVQQLCKL